MRGKQENNFSSFLLQEYVLYLISVPHIEQIVDGTVKKY